jgi:hypothetical protein
LRRGAIDDLDKDSTSEAKFDMGPPNTKSAPSKTQFKLANANSLIKKLSDSTVINDVFGLVKRNSHHMSKQDDEDEFEQYGETLALSLSEYIQKSAHGLSILQQQEMSSVLGPPDSLLPDGSSIGSLDPLSRVGSGRRAHANNLDLTHVKDRQEQTQDLLPRVLQCLEDKNTTESLNLWADLMSAPLDYGIMRIITSKTNMTKAPLTDQAISAFTNMLLSQHNRYPLKN